MRVGTRFLPFADAATKELPLGRLLRLSLFQVSVGASVVLLNGTLNRVMIVELKVPASIVGVMVSIPLIFAPFRALIGFKSDVHKSALGWRRVPFLYKGTMVQFGGLAILPFALLVLSGDGAYPAVYGEIGGALAVMSYSIAIWAMTQAPIALVAALRETSVLFGALIAVLFLGEPLRQTRIIAALMIVAAVVEMRLGVRAEGKSRDLAEREGVEVRYYNVIYGVIDDIESSLKGMRKAEYEEVDLGAAEIREVFRSSKFGNIAGCMVTEGMVKRGNKVRLLRDNVVIHEGTLKTLRRFKDEVREVQNGYECGMAFENYDDIKVGDVIECFDVEEVRPTL